MFKQSDTQKILTKFISKNPNLSTKEIADKLNLNYNSVRGRVSELKKSNLLEVNDDHEYTTTVVQVDPLYITDFSMDNADGSWGNLTVYDWKNSNTGRVELFEA